MSYFLVFPSISPDLPSVSICLLPLSLPQEFRQKVMLGTPFVVIWLVGFIADLDIDSWLIKGLMYAGMWIAVQFLSKYVSTQTHAYTHTRTCSLLSWCWFTMYCFSERYSIINHDVFLVNFGSLTFSCYEMMMLNLYFCVIKLESQI